MKVAKSNESRVSKEVTKVESIKSNSVQQEYIEQLCPIELKALIIAQDHLGSSFDLTKSNGFCSWLKETRDK
jgi:predicted deacetylase